MKDQPFSNTVALRIGLAARELPGVSPADLIEALQRVLGDTIDEEGLRKITVTHLKGSLGQSYNVEGDEDREDRAAGIAAFKEAVRILWGEPREGDELPRVEAYRDDDMPGSVRVAVASNHGERLDGHFGSCLYYLIYQLSAREVRLCDVRSALEADLSPDKNAFRVGRIKDCRILYVVSIGGPAAAKVIKADIHIMPVADGGPAREILAALQKVIAVSPPPWMAKILGVAEGERVRNYKAARVLGG